MTVVAEQLAAINGGDNLHGDPLEAADRPLHISQPAGQRSAVKPLDPLTEQANRQIHSPAVAAVAIRVRLLPRLRRPLNTHPTIMTTGCHANGG